MKVYVPTITAVYDHGTIGVFRSHEAAVAAATAALAESDGHHDVRIDEYELGTALDRSRRLNSPRERFREPDIGFKSWDEVQERDVSWCW